MKKFLVGCGVVGAVLVVIVLGIVGWLINNSNSMVKLGNVVEVKWAAVQSDLQGRYDKINEEFATVQGGANEELAVFQALADQARGLSQVLPVDAQGNPVAPTAEQAQKIQEQAALFSQAVINLKSYAADNPEIQSTKLFSDLMVVIEGAENRLNVSRKDYNAAVGEYQNSVETFPGSLIGSLTGHHADDYGYFNATAAAQNAPTIQFGTAVPPSQR